MNAHINAISQILHTTVSFRTLSKSNDGRHSLATLATLGARALRYSSFFTPLPHQPLTSSASCAVAVRFSRFSCFSRVHTVDCFE